MAANVVGAFTVIDRASRPIRRIREEAQKTDKAVAKLGDSLDRIGTPQQQQRMGRVTAQMRSVSRGAGQASAATRDLNQQLNRAGSSRQVTQLQRTAQQLQNVNRITQQSQQNMQRFDRSTQQSSKSLRGFGGSVMGAGAALKIALIPAVGLALQGIAALGVGVAALLPDLSSLLALMAPLGAGIIGMGVAMATVKLATNDLSKALGGNKNALKSLTPEAREFVRTMKQYSPVLKELRREAQRGLFPGLDLALRRIVRAAPVVQSVLRNMGGTLGRIASSAARWGTRGGFLRDFEMLSGQGGVLLQRGARILMNLGDAMRHIFVVAMPFTDWLTKTVEGWSGSVEGAARLGRETGHLAQWFRRARSDLEMFGRIGSNVFGALGATLTELRPTSDIVWRSIEKLTDKWEQWARSARGRDDMRNYFAQMMPALRQIAGLAGDLGLALGRLSAGSGFTSSVRALRQAIPSLEKGLNAMAEGLGPAVVGALSQVVELFGTLGQHGGALSQVVRLFGGMAKAANWLLENIPGLGTVIATALSVSLISKFGAALVGLAAKWSLVGAAARRATPPVPGPGGGPVPPVPPGGGPPPPAGSRWSRLRGGAGTYALPLAVTGAAVAGSTQGGGMGNALSGAATGAMLGATVGSVIPGVGTGIGAAVGAIGGGALGYFTGRSGAQRDAKTLGGDQALEFLSRGANASAIGGRVSDIQGRLSEQKVLSPGQTSNLGSKPIGATYAPVVTGTERKRLQAQLDALKPALKVQVKLEREQAVRAAQDAGSKLASGLGQAFNVYNRRFGLNKSMRMLRSDVVREMEGLGPVGRKAMGQNVISWAREQARQNPKMWGQVRRLTRRIEDQFNSMGQRVKVVNGRILDGSKEDWARIESAMANPAEKARQRISTALTAMQKEAVTALHLTGFSMSDARKIIKTSEYTGGDIGAAQGAVASGQRYAGMAAASKKARGGRIQGQGLLDTVPVAPNVLAAPGELIANRHTERRVDNMLAAFGTTLGREVAGENRPHFAATGTRVGAGDMATSSRGIDLKGANPSFGPVMSGLRARFGPQLYVMSGSRPGSRIAGSGRLSNHSEGNAIDISWPGLEGAGPGRPPEALNPGGAAALDAVYRYLQTVPKPPRRDLLWRTMQGGNHFNHVHFGMDPGGTLSGAGNAGFSGAGMSGVKPIKARTTGATGVGGLIGNQLLATYAAVLNEKIGAAGMGGGGAGGGGGGVMSFNQVASLAESVGLPGVTFAQIAKGESGLNPAAVGHDPGGTRGLGLWQITTGFNDDVIKQFGGEQAMFSPRSNALAAKTIYDRQGIRAWYGTKYMTDPNLHYTGAALGGRVPEWGGWHGKGGRMRFDRPTMIGVGENGSEDVTVTPRSGGGARGGGAGVTLNIHPGAIVVNGAGRGASDVADEVMERIIAIIKSMGLEPEGAIS